VDALMVYYLWAEVIVEMWFVFVVDLAGSMVKFFLVTLLRSQH
jgi:hypothetical protein